jgi:hypothetical protein
MNIMITGHHGHGKDEAARMLARCLRSNCVSSSQVACELFLFERLKERGYVYDNPEHAWSDRNCNDEMRALWYEEISSYNAEKEHTGLMRAVYSICPIYVGIRDRRELLAGITQGLIDLIIWVDRSEHLPPQDAASMTVLKQDADIIIDNNGTLDDLMARVTNLGNALRK